MCHTRHHLELYRILRSFGDLNPTHLQGQVTNMSRQSLRYENRKDLRKVSNTAQLYPLMLRLTMEIRGLEL